MSEGALASTYILTVDCQIPARRLSKERVRMMRCAVKDIVLAHCTTRAMQDAAVAALDFKCDLLWAQLDAIYWHCVGP